MNIRLNVEASRKFLKETLSKNLIDDNKEFENLFRAVKKLSEEDTNFNEIFAMAETIQYAVSAKALKKEIKVYLLDCLTIKYNSKAENDRIKKILVYL